MLELPLIGPKVMIAPPIQPDHDHHDHDRDDHDDHHDDGNHEDDRDDHDDDRDDDHDHEAHVLAHLLKSFTAYNVKSSSTLFSDNIQ